MKVALIAPLYPPDTSESAKYVQDIAHFLGKQHSVEIYTFSSHPEEIPGVSIHTVSKRLPRIERLFRFFWLLLTRARKAHVLIVHNGPSVELPTLLASVLYRGKIVLHITDLRAHTAALGNPFRRLLEFLVRTRAAATLEGIPVPTPEILPFGLSSEVTQEEYEASWNAHTARLIEILSF